MNTVHTVQELQTALSQIYCSGDKIGFVPTMGALHNGHASLIAESVRHCDFNVVSIFVNPTQFGPNEDLDKYPRTLEADLALCERMGADLVFAPPLEAVYPEGRETYEVVFSMRSMDKVLCGAKRPGHFDGVIQVVSKLFNLVRPHKAFFGLKDFQQVTILKRLNMELFFGVEVVECPIIRETDGLAMSSRNRYLSPDERQQALFLSQSLKKVKAATTEGKSVAELEAIVQNALAEYPLIRLDYFDIRSGHDLSALAETKAEDRPVGLIAAFCGKTRLIDNLPLME